MTTAVWRAPGDPRGTHVLCQALSTPPGYAHFRGGYGPPRVVVRALVADPERLGHSRIPRVLVEAAVLPGGQG